MKSQRGCREKALGMPALCAVVLLILTGGHPAVAIDVKVSQNTDELTPYQILKLTFQHDARYVNPTWDVTIDVEFTSPRGRKQTVGGFFYGSSKPQKPLIQTSPEAAAEQGRLRSGRVIQRTSGKRGMRPAR